MRVSVIIPAYNAARTLPATVQSVLAQGVDDCEIIIVDDESQDETVLVATQLAAEARWPIRVYQQANRGQGAARNRGAAEATGEWLAFLDADDIWLPGSLLARLTGAQINDAQLVYGLVEKMNDAGESLGSLPVRHYLAGAQEGGTLARRIFLGNIIGTSGVMVRRELFAASGGFPETQELRGTEDFDLWMRLTLGGCRCYGLTQSVFTYRDTVGSTSKAEVRMTLGEKLVLHRTASLVPLPPAVIQRRLAMADLAWVHATYREQGAAAALQALGTVSCATTQMWRTRLFKVALGCGNGVLERYWRGLRSYYLRCPDDVRALMK